MKRIKPLAITLIVIMTVMCLTACGTTKKNTGGTGTTGATTQTTAATTTKSMTETTTMTETTGTGAANESTGVINGVVNDVEKGVDKITGESNGQPTSGATKAP